MRNLIQLTQTQTEDDLILSGLYFKGDTTKPAIIFIHGFCGDFYDHKFIHDFADKLIENNYGGVLAQTRGTGERTEMIKTNREDSVDIGAFYEKLEEAHYDISGWIEFLQKQGFTKFILAGHSLGTIKVVRYLTEGKYKDLIDKLVLFAPFDKNGYVENKTKGEWHNHLKIAEEKIKNGEALEIIPNTFDDYQMSYQNYYSWYRESDLNSIWDFYKPDYISPILEAITIPVQVLIGTKDDSFFTKGTIGSFEKSCNYLRNNINNLELNIIENSNHTYVGKEEEVTDKFLEFVQK